MERNVVADSDLEDVLDRVVGLRSGRGHPAVEFKLDDGSTLSLGTDGARAFLVWMNSMGESFSSRGSGEEPSLVYDYFGSWSEASSDALVSLTDAVESVRQFLHSGVPGTETVIFSPD